MINVDEIHVSLPSSLAQFTGGARYFSVPAGTIRQVLENMHDMFPLLIGRIVDEKFQPLPFVRVYVSGEDICSPSRVDSAVAPGSTVMILAAVAGG
ncbi:molybdopterin synthase sulfur carrier subunit [Streptomyces fumanus]|uniref:molybdopterin synthase sulfur carrier subunit n=1 Tax=Streptomyces fumanus TaxID=67302 RepID=UPI00167C9C7F|nr:molybdopterin synthase sulfur carrier subunit [Streptomyces fumanus]